MTRRMLYVSAAIGLIGCIMGGLAWQYGAAIVLRGIIPAAEARPQDGKVSNGSYRNDYFGVSYRLPPGWNMAEDGPDPSQSAYYVLTTFIPDGEPNATILIAAQDMFFAADETGSLADQARDLQQAVSAIAGMTIDREAAETKVAGRSFYRVDYNGVGLYRAMIATEIRCHAFSFNVTARDPELLGRLVQSLESDLSFVPTGDAASASLPCQKGYAEGDNVLQRVQPLPVGPKFV